MHLCSVWQLCAADNAEYHVMKQSSIQSSSTAQVPVFAGDISPCCTKVEQLQLPLILETVVVKLSGCVCVCVCAPVNTALSQKVWYRKCFELLRTLMCTWLKAGCWLAGVHDLFSDNSTALMSCSNLFCTTAHLQLHINRSSEVLLMP